MRLFISPEFYGKDQGYHGGIRRIVDAQLAYFSSVITKDYDDADTLAIHAGSLVPARSDQVLVAHCHGLYWDKYQWGPEGRYINQQVIKAMHIADVITAPTEWVAHSIRRGMNAQVEVIGHAVDPDWKPSKINKGYVLWNKSRIDRVCDPEPVYKLADILPDIDFRMTVGEPRENITITGLTPYADKTPVQHAGTYLATAQETFGIGILESLACGVPVVGWNWGGQAELIDHKVTGWLANVGDYESLAEGVIWCLENRDALAHDCIVSARRYNWEAVCKKYEELYEGALDEKRGRKRVSVIIRNYNTGQYLPDAILSCVDQLSQDDDELIVYDDCSTDNSRSIFDELDIPEIDIQWVQPIKNQGLSGALNYGINASRGEYIVLLDADNMLAKDAIHVMLKELEQNRETDIAYGRVQFVKEDGRTPDQELTGTPDGVSTWPPARFRLEAQLAHKNQIPCTTMYRRRVWERVCPYRNRCRVAEDADFWCRAGVLGFKPKLVTHAPTLIYRNRPGTTSQTVSDWPWEGWYRADTMPLTFDAPTCEPVLVSVVIPVGDGHELYLQDALDSLALQTFKNWECIIVNDTGHDLQYVPQWATIYNTDKPGSGPAKARNIGLDKAKGIVWMPLDADDYIMADALEKMLKEYTRVKGYIYSDFFRVEDMQVVVVPETSCEHLINAIPHVITGLYPLNDIRFDEELELFEDWDYVIQQTQAGNCGSAVKEALVHYRKKSGNRRIQDNDMHRDALRRKWGNNMAGCSTCPKRPLNSTSIPSPQQQLLAAFTSNPLNTEGMTQLVYTGTEAKKFFYGSVSGQKYAFGAIPKHRVKWVLKEDVQGFLDRQQWEVYTGDPNASGVESIPSIII